MDGRDQTSPLDILQAAREIEEFTLGLNTKSFLANRLVQLAVIRQLEAIGEAARRISPDVREAYSQFPWADMIGMRNVLIHGYDAIDLIEVWRVAIEEVPALVRKLEPLAGSAAKEC